MVSKENKNKKGGEEKEGEVEYVEDEEYGSSPDVKSKTKRLKDQLKQCKEEKQEYLEGWQRAKADLINVRKDADKRIAAVHERAGEDLVLELLPVLDNLYLALANAPAADEWAKGCGQVLKQFEAVLKSRGVEEITVVEGDVFNPEEHEAVERQEGEKEDLILEVRRRGYRIRSRVLRSAQVVVSVLPENDSNS